MVDDATLHQLSLSRDEYRLILERLGRTPNELELGIFGALWSEHCGYKNSRPLLRLLPSQSERVLTAVGEENAGAVDIGHGWLVAMKIESHNHPSAVEPYEGAATGVGGIVRDIFAMGARPIALLDSLRFGTISPGDGDEDDATVARNRYLFGGVVGGIGGYGNTLGLPTVGGETYFEPAYSGNPLVNAMCVGLARHGSLVSARAEGPGNLLLLVGSDTGRDGIHGATFASVELDESSEERRPAVQVGNPLMEKLLIEACIELVEEHRDLFVGLQDLGAAGLTSAAIECAARAGTGIIINTDQVPRREQNMTPYEVMLSESQERMLVIAKRGREGEIGALFDRWDLHCAVIGEVTDDGFVRIRDNGVEVATLPVGVVTDAPQYVREGVKPDWLVELQGADLEEMVDLATYAPRPGGRDLSPGPSPTRGGAPSAGGLDASDHGAEPVSPEDAATVGAPPLVGEGPGERSRPPGLGVRSGQTNPDIRPTPNAALLRLLASPNIASKRPIFRQYDHQVLTNTVIGPGGDAAVLRVRGTPRGIALCTDGNGRLTYLDPFAGGAIAVCEAARNVVCTGAEPIALTNCLNFGNPEKPDVYYQLEQAIRGIAAAADALGVPVISGNVSLYNETLGEAVYPTPVIGMLGLIDDMRHHVGAGFVDDGDQIFLLGGPSSEALIGDAETLAGSEYQRSFGPRVAGRPRIDLAAEVALQRACLAGIRRGLICSAHDCADGGLAVALAECAMLGGRGCDASSVAIRGRFDAALFGEAQSRIIVTCRPDDAAVLRRLAEEHGVHCLALGVVGGESVRIGRTPSAGYPVIAESLSGLRAAYDHGLVGHLAADVLAPAT